MKAKRRAMNMFSRAKDWLLEHAYLVTFASAIAIIAGAAMFTEQVRLQQEKSLEAAAQAAELSATALPEIIATPLPTIAPLALTQTAYRPRIVTVKPVSGEIVRAYAKEPILWEALGVIQSHEGIDIVGKKDESVLSAMDGVVKDAAMDALWGWRVTIAHTDGSEGTYAGLALTYVLAGQSVSRGEEIGTLMESIPCEKELGPHLHFELKKNGVKQDPEGILPE